MDVDSLRNTLEAELRKIDEAAADCFVTHKAEAEFLQSFFRKTVEEVDWFLRRAKELRFLNGARMKVDMLNVALANCLTYVKDRSSASVYQYMISSASKPSSEKTSYSVTSQDLEDEAKTAVQEGIVEPVVVHVERTLKRGGSPLHHRDVGGSAVELMYAIEDMDKVLCFGHSDMATYDRRINDERKLDVLVRSVQRSVSSLNLLRAEFDKLAAAVDATRVTLEKNGCPLVFFMAPPAATKGTWLDKARRMSVLNKRMDLHFVCRVFFENLRKALSKGSNVTTNPNPMTSEFSLPIEVKQPRKYVTKLKPVIKLSLLVINLITHAAAIGIGVGGIIPYLNLSEHEDLLDVMQAHLEDFDEKTETDLPSEDNTDAHGPDVLPKLTSLHSSAHMNMKLYLETHHATTWQEAVHANLQIALNTRDVSAFVCKGDPRHKVEWENSHQAHP